MNSSDNLHLPAPGPIWYGGLGGIAALILVCLVVVLIGPRAFGNAGISTAGITSATPTGTTAAQPQGPAITPSEQPVPRRHGPSHPGSRLRPGCIRDTPVPRTVCNPRSQFVANVTIPDGTAPLPGTTFVKTWRVVNAGDCPWTSRASISFANGWQLGAAPSASIPPAAPGESVDISISMVAPDSPGSYAGTWLLQTAGGIEIGELTVAICCRCDANCRVDSSPAPLEYPPTIHSRSRGYTAIQIRPKPRAGRRCPGAIDRGHGLPGRRLLRSRRPARRR